ncbi:amino acid permease [Luteolibacter sp. LG18]|uniref:APC family permease n=1 Tax=Luteolibacter sp. LG18 TaxID=2819286 RepID=UPI0030C6B8DA
MSEKSHAGSASAVALVVANMIGTGVFVSLHYQLFDFHAAPPILLLWIVGGLISLCGALCYATLAKALPRSGGEYHYLTELYHPSLGFMSGLLSAVVGFAAPTAISALALGRYLHSSQDWVRPDVAAYTVIILGTLAHAMSARTSGRVQVAATSIKLTLIVGFLIAAVVLPGKGDIRWLPEAGDAKAIWNPAFATALMFVFYAYSGWNAAVYGLEEWQRPESTVKRALIGGSLLVMFLYIGLNAAFLKAAPVADLAANEEIADAAARSLFGPAAARWTSGLLAIGLFSSVSALLWAGPRVLGSMGRDVAALRWFAPKDGVPLNALVFQTVLALAFVWFGQLDTLVNYTQSGLTLCSALAVAGIFILRRRGQASAPHLILSLIFIGMAGFVILQSLVKEFTRPAPADGYHLASFPTLCGLLTALACALLWFPLNRKSP